MARAGGLSRKTHSDEKKKGGRDSGAGGSVGLSVLLELAELLHDLIDAPLER